MSITFAVIVVIIIIAIYCFAKYYPALRERYGVCLDCDQQLAPFGAAINPFVWPFSGGMNIDSIRKMAAVAEPVESAETFMGRPKCRCRDGCHHSSFHDSFVPPIDDAVIKSMYHNFVPDHPPNEGRS